MSQPMTVTGRTVQNLGGSLVVAIPAETVDRYGIQKGDQILWHDEGDGEPIVRPPDRD